MGLDLSEDLREFTEENDNLSHAWISLHPSLLTLEVRDFIKFFSRRKSL